MPMVSPIYTWNEPVRRVDRSHWTDLDYVRETPDPSFVRKDEDEGVTIGQLVRQIGPSSTIMNAQKRAIPIVTRKRKFSLVKR